MNIKYFILSTLFLSACSNIEVVNKEDKANPEATEKPVEVVVANQPEPEMLNDLVVDDDFNIDKLKIDQELRYNQIRISKKGKIITNGRTVRLYARQVVSDDGQIVSFKSFSDTKPGENGKNGGRLELKTKKILGKLTINLSGENGGDGLDAVDLTYNKGQAKNGANGAFEIVNDHINNTFTPRCVKVPENGADGVIVGDIGKDGMNGGHGGNKGEVILDIEDKNTLVNLFDVSKPGLGGRGGFGGLGSFGELGGLPGKMSINNQVVDTPEIVSLCPKAVSGKDAARGSRGRNGYNGKDGN